MFEGVHLVWGGSSQCLRGSSQCLRGFISMFERVHLNV